MSDPAPTGASAEAEAYRKVYRLLEREAEKARVELGDRDTADFVSMLIAKIKAVESGQLKVD